MSEATTEARTRSAAPTSAREAAAATGISIVGAICGTLITAAFEGAPSQKLTGAVIGAIVATLFTVTGPYLHIRAAAGVAVTGVALVLTYGGVAVADTITGNTTYPKIPTASSRPSAPPSAVPRPNETCEGSLCLTVPARQEFCVVKGCHAAIPVTNTGSRQIRIKDVEIDGVGASAFQRNNGCANRTLKVDQECSIVITLLALPAGEAALVIHQNLKGPATRVALVASPSADSRPNLRMSTKATCSYTATGSPHLSVETAIRNDGPGFLDKPVMVRVAEAGGQTQDFTAGIGNVVLSLPTTPAVDHALTLTVDPRDEIDEVDESNNTRHIAIALEQFDEGNLNTARCILT